MKSFILRGLIVISLLGIVVVVGIMFFQNLNAEVRTADSIANAQEKVDFKYLDTKGRELRAVYMGPIDEYAVFVCDKMVVLQYSIQRYVGFLRYAKGLDRNEASKLDELNKAYVEELSSERGAIARLEDYHEYYVREDMATNPSTQYNLKGMNADFVRQYNKAYSKGMELYEMLKGMVLKYTFNDMSKLQFVDIYHDAINKYAAETYDAIETNMLTRKEANDPIKALSHYDAYNNFVKMKNKAYYLNDINVLTNTNIITFVNAYNAIDFKLLITNLEYQSNATGELLSNINIVKDFFDTRFAINLGTPLNVD